MPQGTIKATVLIETILAAFEMDEILYELREHSAGLNAGRWDYIFSVIKKLGHRPEFVLPDRAAVTMAVPFMRAYTELLVKTCHARGAHAIGGMAAFIPSRRDPEVNAVALAKVREDKEREAGQGFDGTWVAHPDLVPVAMEIFDRVLGDRPNQLDRQRPDVSLDAPPTCSTSPRRPARSRTEGLRNNVSVGIQYLAAWLRGSGAVAIFNLMEDAATSEISRSQVWQWLRHGRVERADVERAIDEEVAKLGEGYDEARELFEQVALRRGVRRVPHPAGVRATWTRTFGPARSGRSAYCASTPRGRQFLEHERRTGPDLVRRADRTRAAAPEVDRLGALGLPPLRGQAPRVRPRRPAREVLLVVSPRRRTASRRRR